MCMCVCVCVCQYNVLCVLVCVLLAPICLQCCQYITKLVLLTLLSSLLLLSVLLVNDIVLDAPPPPSQLRRPQLNNYTQYARHFAPSLSLSLLTTLPL